MTQSPTQRRDPVKVAVVALGIVLAILAALIAFLVWGRPAPRVPAPPIPSTSPTTSPTAAAQPEPSASTKPTTATPAPTPSATTPAPSPESPSATSSASAQQTMMWEGKATFEFFTAEVLRDDAPGEDTAIEGKAALLVEVCLTGDIDGSGKGRITSAPWTMEDSTGTVQKPQAGGYEPVFPASVEVAVGECARGYLTFDYLEPDGDGVDLVYENGLGDRAIWQFH
ncbi:hypothetical protein [Tessaracoccus sp.]